MDNGNQAFNCCSHVGRSVLLPEDQWFDLKMDYLCGSTKELSVRMFRHWTPLKRIDWFRRSFLYFFLPEVNQRSTHS